jgi:hypothetical protein
MNKLHIYIRIITIHWFALGLAHIWMTMSPPDRFIHFSSSKGTLCLPYCIYVHLLNKIKIFKNFYYMSLIPRFFELIYGNIWSGRLSRFSKFKLSWFIAAPPPNRTTTLILLVGYSGGVSEEKIGQYSRTTRE